MEKKMVGILAGVAAVHVVLLAGLMASGGCRQPEILGNQTYNNGPALGEIPAPTENVSTKESAPTVPGGELPAVPTTASSEKSGTTVYPGLNSVPPSTSKTTATAGMTTYKVVKGDTLSGIAYQHGVKTRELMACNNLTAKSILRIGQELKIPEGGVYHAERKTTPKTGTSTKNTKNTASGVKNTKPVKTATTAVPTDGIHVVASGDTLDRIGRKYGVSAKAIAQENNIALNKVLHIGDKLRIPGKGAAISSEPTGTQGKTDSSGLPLDNGMDLDPNIGLTPTTGTPTADPGTAATPTTGTPTADPGTPVAASPTTPTTGVTGGSTALANTETLQVPNDMTAEQFCKMYNVKMEDLKRLNPDLPADGNLKSGAHMIVPTLQTATAAYATSPE